MLCIFYNSQLIQTGMPSVAWWVWRVMYPVANHWPACTVSPHRRHILWGYSLVSMVGEILPIKAPMLPDGINNIINMMN